MDLQDPSHVPPAGPLRWSFQPTSNTERRFSVSSDYAEDSDGLAGLRKAAQPNRASQTEVGFGISYELMKSGPYTLSVSQPP